MSESIPVRKPFLLLINTGGWTNAGPNHGRECLFESEQAALDWAIHWYGEEDYKDMEFVVIDIRKQLSNG